MLHDVIFYFISDCGEFPTLLHFSACHGLAKLTGVLLDCAGSTDAIQMRNVSEMTPAELANVNGHFDLANKLHSLHIELYRSSQQDFSKQHVYDYIQQNNYSIPPPPRPVQPKSSKMAQNTEHIGAKMAQNPDYSLEHIGPKPDKNRDFEHIGANRGQNPDYSLQHIGPKSDKNPDYLDDPFGTLRAAKKISNSPEDSDDEVFIDNDKFGTLKANNYKQDYRDTSKNDTNEELAITDEFLKLLDDLQSKNYSPKEMENLFENWKRKADLKISNPKSKKVKATNLLLKLFKNHGLMHSQSDPHIKATKDTKTYRKPSKPEVTEVTEVKNEVKSEPEPIPIMENQSIIEGGDITIINAEELELLENPPQKSPKSPESPESSTEGISTQILPLSRLSLSSNNSPPEPSKTAKEPVKPIAEVQPFVDKVQTRAKTSPVRDKLDKIRRSLTEPIIQYLQDLHSSTDSEEPEVLNTPKSVASEAFKSKNFKSKSLFSDEEEAKKPTPPPLITDM